MKRVLALIAVSAAISTAAAAQDTRPDSVACTDSVATGLYRRCALRIEGGKVRRGVEGVVVAKPRFFRPTALTRVVAGDSAVAYAGLFERRSGQASALQLVGGFLYAGAYVVLARRDCVPTGFGFCDYRDNHDWIAGSMAIGGLALSITGVVFQVKAQRAASRAVWWNNERFAR